MGGPANFFVLFVAKCWRRAIIQSLDQPVRYNLERIEMTNSELVFKLEISVSGAEGWHERMALAIENVAVLVREEQILGAQGDGSDHTFNFNITLGNPR